MNIEDERVRFEKWFLPEKGWNCCFDMYKKSQVYIYQDVQNSFDAWIAAKKDTEAENVHN